ncbi:31807_t:CDS:2, partial [Gigaspora margarita]
RAICQGLRPELPTWTSKDYTNLYKRCVDANFSKRPSIYEIFEIIAKWKKNPKCITELNNSYKLRKKNFLKNKKIHSEAIYISRLFTFENLLTQVKPKSISSQKNHLPSVEEEIDGPPFFFKRGNAFYNGLKRGPAVKIANLIKEILRGEEQSKKVP